MESARIGCIIENDWLPPVFPISIVPGFDSVSISTVGILFPYILLPSEADRTLSLEEGVVWLPGVVLAFRVTDAQLTPELCVCYGMFKVVKVIFSTPLFCSQE